ncbi:MAG TPA: cytochrome P450, partial [Actinopolymorphaceae bacterium]|nr:cytochrome P450 [Actinopolymorphaceae bacterium]
MVDGAVRRSPLRDGLRLLRRDRVARPAGPRRLGLLAGLSTRRDPTAYFEAVVRAHPRLSHLRLGKEHIYVLGHPELVYALYVGHGRKTRKGRTLERIRILLGDGLLTSEGELHRTQRRLIQPALHGDRMIAYADAMVATARDHADRWRDGAELDMAREISGLTLTVVGNALFGSDLAAVTDQVADSLGTLLFGFQRHMFPGSDVLLRIPTPGRARLFGAVDRLDRLVREVIADRRTAPPGPDLLSALLASMEDDTQVRDEVMTLLLAGHETTATALTWTWWLLSEHPRVARWLHEELDALPGEAAPHPSAIGGSRPPLSYADLDRLPRTRAVFAESMRLYPPSWILGRRTLDDVELDGWTVPAGSLCVASQWVMHRDARFWSDPLEFRPGRWLTDDGRFDESAPGQPRGAYLPFGIGS